MKKLSLFSLFGLMAFVTMPIYAEENDVYADENYAVVTENVDTEERGNKVEENDVVLAVEEEPIIEWSTDLDESTWDMGEDTLLQHRDILGWGDYTVGNNNYTQKDIKRNLWMAAWIWILYIVELVLLILLIIAMCKIFTKAWRKRWEAIIPFYNVIVFWEIAGLKKYLWVLGVLLILYILWWFLDSIPFYEDMVDFFSIAAFAVMNFSLARKFWRWTVWSIMCVLFSWICYLILWFWKAKYEWKTETVVEA